MDANIEKWRVELLRRGYQEKKIDFTKRWYERKWFSIDGHDSSILQIWYGQIYTRIVLSSFGTPEKPYTFGRYCAVINPEYPKDQWRRDGYHSAYKSAEEIWTLL